MSPLSAHLVADKARLVERHLARVAEKLPASPADLAPASDVSDAVILHLWQATQIVIDIAVSACVHLGLGAPATYGEAFTRLRDSGIVPPALAEELVRAAGFRNLVAHAYESVDLQRVHAAASRGPASLRALLAAVASQLTDR
jgi:uncharacterized protein YutE (UPF0331/DUF86 family)